MRVLLLAVVATAALAAGCGSTSSSERQGLGPGSGSRYAASDYRHWLPASLSVKKAAAPLCYEFRSALVAWTDPSQKGGGADDFKLELASLAHHRLREASTSAGSITFAMSDAFLEDALVACHQRKNVRHRLASLEKHPLVRAPKPAEPEPYWSAFSGNPSMSFHWGSQGPCSRSTYDDSWCVLLRVKSDYGCDNVYAEINLLNKYDGVIDYTNATLGALEAGQEGRLRFQLYDTKGVKSWTLTKLDCY